MMAPAAIEIVIVAVVVAIFAVIAAPPVTM